MMTFTRPSLILIAVLTAGTVHAQNEHAWTYTYNALGLVDSADGPRTDVNDSTTFEYDPQGNLTRVTNALGHRIHYHDHNALGQPQRIVDSNGIETRLTYHPRGWLLSSERDSQSGPIRTEYRYDAVGNLTELILPENSTLTFDYDGARRLTAIQNSLGQRIETTLDAAGNRLEERILDSNSQLTYSLTRTFDELSRLLSLVGQNINYQYRYDANDNPISDTNGRNHTTTHVYDALDRIIRVIDPDQHQTNFTYDHQGRLDSVTDARNVRTSYHYDAFDQLIQVDSPDSGSTRYQYDDAGNRILATDARGIVTNYRYDALNRLTHVEYPDSPEGNLTFIYDEPGANNGIGRLTRVTHSQNEHRYDYTEAGQLSRQQYRIEQQAYELAYEYDQAGRIQSIDYPSGRRVHYTYDSAGQITDVQVQNGANHYAFAKNARYLPFGPLSHFERDNGQHTQLEYDQDYSLTRILTQGPGPVFEQSYAYDSNRNISRINSNSDEQHFDYDALDRLISASGFYGDIDYGYDPVGNRRDKLVLQLGQDDSLEYYIYDLNSNRLHSIDKDGQISDLYYDPAGNIVYDARSQQSTEYNAANRPTRTRQNQKDIRYAYNYLGQRTLKQSEQGTEHYHYDQNGQLIAVTNENGLIQSEYVYLNNRVVGMIDQQGEYYSALSDHLNTVQRLINDNAQVVWEVSRTPFGETEVDADPDGDGQRVVFNLRFPGQYFDEETNLNYNYFRYYDPTTGRYTTADLRGILLDFSDPLRQVAAQMGIAIPDHSHVDGLNHLYGYVNQNPIIYTDPTGEVGLLGAGIAIIIETGVQLARNGGRLECLDVADILIAGAIGAVAPGALSSLKHIKGGIGASKTLNKQLSRAKASSRRKKLNRRIKAHRNRIANEVATQALFQGGKAVAKEALDLPASGQCGCQ